MIELCSGEFAITVERTIAFLDSGIPPRAWFNLLKTATAFPSEKDGTDGKGGENFRHAWNKPSHWHDDEPSQQESKKSEGAIPVHRKATDGLCGAQAFMSPQVVLGLIVEGLKTNLWGLGCPSYCTQPSVGLLGCVFLLGWISGLGVALGFCIWLIGFPSHSLPVVLRPSASRLITRAQVLASYLHEPTSIQQRRRS